MGGSPDRRDDEGVQERRSTPHGELVLRRRAGETEIIVGGTFLMSTACRASERALATLALAATSGIALRVLVGGLGAGHTLEAALGDPRVAEVMVAELFAELVEWARRGELPAARRALEDPRVRLVVGDLVSLLGRGRRWDAILLDVDNGPSWLSTPANARLYQMDGSRELLASLAPRGVLAVWSAQEEPGWVPTISSAAGSLGISVRTERRAVAVPLAQAGDGRSSIDWVYLVQRID